MSCHLSLAPRVPLLYPVRSNYFRYPCLSIHLVTLLSCTIHYNNVMSLKWDFKTLVPRIISVCLVQYLSGATIGYLSKSLVAWKMVRWASLFDLPCTHFIVAHSAPDLSTSNYNNDCTLSYKAGSTPPLFCHKELCQNNYICPVLYVFNFANGRTWKN